MFAASLAWADELQLHSRQMMLPLLGVLSLLGVNMLPLLGINRALIEP